MSKASPRSVAEAAPDNDRILRITRRFNAPRPLVYRMFTDAAHLARWFGPEGFTVPECKVEPRPGGRFYADMLSPDGNHHRIDGRFKEVVADRRVVFTWAWLDAAGKPGHETTVTIDLAEKGGETELSMLHELFENAEQKGKHAHGWTSCFVCLDRALAELQA